MATLGTHLRADLVDELRAFHRQFLVRDNDDAGLEATLTVRQQLGDSAIPVALPDGVKDPSQLATWPAGREQFAAALLRAAGHMLAVPLRTVFLHGAAARVPVLRPPTPRRASKEQFGGLTEREREVAGLITVGCSNREIAQRLIVSDRTVEAHVRSIMDRLALSSRVQVAAWAQAHGLESSDLNTGD